MAKNSDMERRVVKERLFTPGPTPVPPDVSQEMAYPIVHHRTPQFTDLLLSTTEGLRYLFQTKQDVLVLTGSGTSAMEATVVNLQSAGDEAITVEGGKFGQRWTELCRTYGINAHVVSVPWGEAVTVEQVLQALEAYRNARVVYLTHSETSTGTVIDLQNIAAAIKANSDALVVVDAITSLGAMPIHMDEWQLDAVVCGSQKGFMMPPGLALLAFSARAWEAAESRHLPSYYLNMLKARKALKDGTTAFTPAITLFQALHVAVEKMQQEGLERMWRRHRTLAEATRAGAAALNLELFAKSPSNSVTPVLIPESLQEHNLVKHLKQKYGITVAGGQAQLKGKVFRIAHLGYFDTLDMTTILSAVEMALRDFGWACDYGAGVSAAMRVFNEAE